MAVSMRNRSHIAMGHADIGALKPRISPPLGHRQQPRLGQRQHGLGMWGWLFVLVVLASALTLSLKLGPHYIDFRIAQGILDNLPAEEVHKQMSRVDIYDHFQKQMRIESIYRPAKELVEIDRNRERTIVRLSYEQREHLVANVDAILTFADERTYE